MAFRRKQYRVSYPNKVSEKSLTAAGARVRKGDAENLRRLVQPWQERSFSYYDQLGEIKYAAQFYARMLAPLKLYSAEIDEKGDIVPSENEVAKEQLERIQDPGGGRTGLLSTYGRLRFLTGEALLFCSKDPDTDLEQWEMLSSDELRMQSGVYMRYKAPSLQAEEYREPNDDDWAPVEDNTAVAYRLWNRHPRYSELADATMQGVLELCEELVLLTHAVRARARSRLAGNGILFLADELSMATPEAVPDEDVQEDPFMAALIEAMLAPIADEGAASAVVPIIVRGPADAIDKGIMHLQLVDPTQLYPETGLRRECIDRIALGLDMPAEVLLGMSQANHWTAWQIDEQTWKGHGAPVATGLVEDLTAAFYRPQLRELGVDNWQNHLIAYDAAAIINHPDRAQDAKDLHSVEVISDEALRDATGFKEEDAIQDDVERNRRIGVKLRDSSLAVYGIPSLQRGGIEPEAGVIEEGDSDAAATAAEVQPGPARSQNGKPVTAGADLHSSVWTARILGAADLTLLRTREAAGNRLLSLAKRDNDVRKMLTGVKTRDVAATLGPNIVRKLNAPPERELVMGARDIIGDALRMWGIGDDVAALIIESVEQHAARTLYELRPSPLPPSFTNYVAGLSFTSGAVK